MSRRSGRGRSGRGRILGGRRWGRLLRGCGEGRVVIEGLCLVGGDRGGGIDLLRFCEDSSEEAEEDDGDGDEDDE